MGFWDNFKFMHCELFLPMSIYHFHNIKTASEIIHNKVEIINVKKKVKT